MKSLLVKTGYLTVLVKNYSEIRLVYTVIENSFDSKLNFKFTISDYIFIHFLFAQVLYRSDVSLIHPEGTDWINVPVPGEQIKSVSCGANKLLWALNYDGEVLIRSGITLNNPIGIHYHNMSN